MGPAGADSWLLQGLSPAGPSGEGALALEPGVKGSALLLVCDTWVVGLESKQAGLQLGVQSGEVHCPIPTLGPIRIFQGSKIELPRKS